MRTGKLLLKAIFGISRDIIIIIIILGIFPRV